MTVSDVKVIQLSDEEKSLLSEAGRLLRDLAEAINDLGTEEEDFVLELYRAYETCLDVVYGLDDGDE